VDSAVAERLVCFGADGVSVFQGCRSGVTQQLKEHDAPFHARGALHGSSHKFGGGAFVQLTCCIEAGDSLSSTVHVF
jgi:hypothetical protein